MWGSIPSLHIIAVTWPSYFSNVHVPHLSNKNHHLIYNQWGYYKVAVTAQSETVETITLTINYYYYSLIKNPSVTLLFLEATWNLSISMGAGPHNPHSLWDFYIKENGSVAINRLPKQHEQKHILFREEANQSLITFNELFIWNTGHNIIYSN